MSDERDALVKRISEIEGAISAGTMGAAQVFTQMRQLLTAPSAANVQGALVMVEALRDEHRTAAHRMGYPDNTPLYAAPPLTAQGDANSGWISVADRLPETFLYDDTQCFIRGMKVDPLYRSKSALVALGSHGVGVDVIERIGDSKPFWSSFGKRVTHWMEMPPIPAAPMTAASVTDERK